MKTTTRLAVALLALSASSALGQNIWYYGASDNSANFGVSADSSTAITWQDGWASADTLDDVNFFGSVSLQATRPSMINEDQSIMLFGFAGIGLASADVTSAMLYLRQDFSFPYGSPNTWNIVGLAAGNDSWDTPSMTWLDIDGAGAGDWTGGTLLGSLTGSYGSFADLGGGVDANLSIDITSAFSDYLDGTISGIAFVNSAPGDSFSSTDYAFVPYSNDNLTATNHPGLLVTVIPEPSAVMLGAIGVLALFRRRR